jgi:antitoxin ParD1/3/4
MIMPTRNVVLTDHHEMIVADLVRSGRYQNASEVLREGLRLVEAREAREDAKLKALQDAALGFDDLDAGRYCEIGLDKLESVIKALGRQAGEQVARHRPVVHGDISP